ncbi:NUDIX hydrolase [Aliisedimentitalea scapharcae]|uniref:NUDIX hydrolase n=1 Tax=Aliisedimentitalea scapharcae TaxID=1524259 RepID=A0ABZ2XZ80_9RHOB|nr:NUDIX hydrolase [Rhodobacteraceae bacterium M382]
MAEEPRKLPEQYGALCYRCGIDGVEILLVSSRKSGHWIAPKGNPSRGLEPMTTAVHEAWEEAGVRGALTGEDVGSYLGVRSRAGREEQVRVHLFPLRVDVMAADFPEEPYRRRRWFRQHDAADAVHNPGLARIMRDFVAPEVTSLSQAS